MPHRHKNILLIRPETASRRWAEILSARGYHVLISPLLRIEATHTPFPQTPYQAVIFTSANAADMMGLLKKAAPGSFDMPCYCVGEATALAAQKAGFTQIRTTRGDGLMLAHHIAATLQDRRTPLLHICGDYVEVKWREFLAHIDIDVTEWPIYRAFAVNNFSDDARAAFVQGDISHIPVFSPRSARILVATIQKNDLIEACSNITAIALSQVVADVLQPLPWRRLAVAATPNADDLLACLETAS